MDNKTHRVLLVELVRMVFGGVFVGSVSSSYFPSYSPSPSLFGLSFLPIRASIRSRIVSWCIRRSHAVRDVRVGSMLAGSLGPWLRIVSFVLTSLPCVPLLSAQFVVSYCRHVRSVVGPSLS